MEISDRTTAHPSASQTRIFSRIKTMDQCEMIPVTSTIPVVWSIADTSVQKHLQTLVSSSRLLFVVAAFLGTDLVEALGAGDFGFGSGTLSVSTLTSFDSASLFGVCNGKLFLIMLMTLGAFSVGTGGAICTLSPLALAFGVDLPKMLETLPATCSAKLFRGSTLGFGAAMVVGAFGGMAFATLAIGIAGAFLTTGATYCVAAPTAISVTLMVGVLTPGMVFGGTTGTTSETTADTAAEATSPVAVCVACVVKAT